MEPGVRDLVMCHHSKTPFLKINLSEDTEKETQSSFLRSDKGFGAVCNAKKNNNLKLPLKSFFGCMHENFISVSLEVIVAMCC